MSNSDYTKLKAKLQKRGQLLPDAPQGMARCIGCVNQGVYDSFVKIEQLTLCDTCEAGP